VRGLASWGALAAIGVGAVSSYAQSDGVLLQYGIDLLETRGDCSAAVDVFERLAGSSDRSVASRALIHLAQCLELTQRGNAVSVYRRIVREYADQKEAKRLAEDRLKTLAPANAEASLSAVIQGASAFTIINRISTGAEPFEAIASLDGSHVFVTNLSEPSVAIVDTETNEVTKTISLQAPPHAAALSLDGSHLLLAFPTRIEAIDLQSGGSAAFEIEAEAIHDLAPAPNGGVYLATGGTGLKRLDLSTGGTRMVWAEPCPMALALSPNQKRLWVNYQCGGPGGRPGHAAIGEFDAVSGQLLNTITGLPNVGGWIRISPDGRLLMAYAGDACSHPIYDHVGCEKTGVLLAHVFNADSRKLQRSIAFHTVAMPGPYRFVPGRQLVAVATGGSLSFLETREFSVVTSLPLHTSGRLAFSSDGARAFVPLPSEDAVAVVWLGAPSQH
jgi:YVTN family beta-propeller protein